MAKATDFGSSGLWARVNALNSPWFLDDMTWLVGEIGDKLDVVMIPKVEGEWDIHFVDQYLALLEARHGLKKPILVHAIMETAEGVNNVEANAAVSPRMDGMGLGPADLAASRAMKTTRVGGGHPDYAGGRGYAQRLGGGDDRGKNAATWKQARVIVAPSRSRARMLITLRFTSSRRCDRLQRFAN